MRLEQLTKGNLPPRVKEQINASLLLQFTEGAMKGKLVRFEMPLWEGPYPCLSALYNKELTFRTDEDCPIHVLLSGCIALKSAGPHSGTHTLLRLTLGWRAAPLNFTGQITI